MRFIYLTLPNLHTTTPATCIPELGQKCWLDRPDSLPTQIQRGSLGTRLRCDLLTQVLSHLCTHTVNSYCSDIVQLYYNINKHVFAMRPKASWIAQYISNVSQSFHMCIDLKQGRVPPVCPFVKAPPTQPISLSTIAHFLEVRPCM